MTSPAGRSQRAQLNVVVDPELQRLLNAVVDARNALDRPLNVRTAVKAATQDWIANALKEPAVADLVRNALESDMVLSEPMRKYSPSEMAALLNDLGRADLAGVMDGQPPQPARASRSKAPRAR